ncbi:hypothetical protein ACFLRI_05395, partial [Bacteroidota bacterium]
MREIPSKSVMIRSLINLISVILFIGLTACSDQSSKNIDYTATETEVQSIPLARIDSFYLTDIDVEYKMKIEQAYGNVGINSTQAFIMSFNNLLDYALLKNFDIEVSEEELQRLKWH